MDDSRISFTPAVELFYLNEVEQQDLLDQMELNDCTPSLSQACRFKKLSQAEGLTPELVNRLITKIEVFDSTKDENGKKHVPIKVHFIGVGVIVIPDGKTILETYEEIRKNPPRVA